PLDLEHLAREVIDKLVTLEREVQDQDGRWYSLRGRPHTTADTKSEGAEIALRDIDALKRSERDAETARRLAEATIRTVRDPLLVLDGALRVKMAKNAFYRTLHAPRRDTEGKLIYERGGSQWDVPALRALLEEILPRDSFFNDF